MTSKEDEFKQSLENQLRKKHLDLINFVESLHVNSKMKEYALMNFDQGYLWTREAIIITSSTVENEVPHPLCGTLGGGL